MNETVPVDVPVSEEIDVQSWLEPLDLPNQESMNETVPVNVPVSEEIDIQSLLEPLDPPADFLDMYYITDSSDLQQLNMIPEPTSQHLDTSFFTAPEPMLSQASIGLPPELQTLNTPLSVSFTNIEPVFSDSTCLYTAS